MEKVNAVEWVSSDPTRFFQRGVNSIGILASVMGDVLTLGGGDCSIRKWRDWWIVGSNRDWLGTDPAQLFVSVVADARLGVHSMRSEILVFCFCTDVAFMQRDSVVAMKGQPPDGLDQNLVGDLASCILFRV